MATKAQFIRSLVMHRIANDSIAKKRGATQQDVQRLSDLELMGTPEASAVTIVENYKALTGRGLSDEAAFAAIAKLRNLANAPKAALQSLHALVKYDVSEGDHGLPISDAFVELAIEKAIAASTVTADKGINRAVVWAHAATGFAVGIAIMFFVHKNWAAYLAALPFLYGARNLWIAITASDATIAAKIGDSDAE